MTPNLKKETIFPFGLHWFAPMLACFTGLRNLNPSKPFRAVAVTQQQYGAC